MHTYQIYIELLGIKPKIWRRILIPSNLSLNDFHKVIQTTMGWTNSHLHHFIKGRDTFEPPVPEDDLWGESYGTDYTGIKVDMLLNKVNDALEYEYDFGDSWVHKIKLEKIKEEEPIKYPKCIGGAMACPPEDCGGTWGYTELLKAMKNPKHPQHDELLDWYGGEFDPSFFDAEEVNELLSEDNFGVMDFDDDF